MNRCGNRVTTIRYRTEKWKELSNTQVTIIRINPDFPLPDSQMDADFPFISIMSRGKKTENPNKGKIRKMITRKKKARES